RGVELPEVDGGGDDDRPAGDGRDRARDLRAALLFSDRQSERDGAPDDQEPSEEGHAARYEPDYVREHFVSPFFGPGDGRLRVARDGRPGWYNWSRSASRAPLHPGRRAAGSCGSWPRRAFPGSFGSRRPNSHLMGPP